jgi:hypothetical protein
MRSFRQFMPFILINFMYSVMLTTKESKNPNALKFFDILYSIINCLKVMGYSIFRFFTVHITVYLHFLKGFIFLALNSAINMLET